MLPVLMLCPAVVPTGPRARFGLDGMEATCFVVRSSVKLQEPVPAARLAGEGMSACDCWVVSGDWGVVGCGVGVGEVGGTGESTSFAGVG